MKNNRYASVGVELTELYEWQRSARNKGFISFVGLVGANVAADVSQVFSRDTVLIFGLLSVCMFLGGYYLYRLHYLIERMSVQIIVLQEEILRTQEVLISYGLDQNVQSEARTIASNAFER